MEKGAERVGDWRTNRDHSNYSIVAIWQNTENSSGKIRWLAVSQTPVNTGMKKSHKKWNNNNRARKLKNMLLVVIYNGRMVCKSLENRRGKQRSEAEASDIDHSNGEINFESYEVGKQKKKEPLKLENHFGRNISSIESDVNRCQADVWNAFDICSDLKENSLKNV